MNYELRDITKAELDFLNTHGFVSIGSWRFECDGSIYDLSATDLSQTERIKAEKLFIEDRLCGNCGELMSQHLRYGICKNGAWNNWGQPA